MAMTPAAKSQRLFLLMIGFSVVVLSFAYGLSVGLRRPGHWAHARTDSLETPLDESELAALISELGLPREIELTRVGRNARVNGRPVSVVSFGTGISPERVLLEQSQFWQSSGFKVASTGGAHRGVLIGFDPISKRKLSLSVWTVPAEIRKVTPGGKPVQGMLSILEEEKENNGAPEPQLVPEIPLMPGGRGGAVFRSDEGREQSYSSVYTNPGSLDDSMDFYRRELGSAGWSEMNGDMSQGKLATGHLIFRREAEEVVLLLTPKSAEAETVVAVFRGPKMENQRGVF